MNADSYGTRITRILFRVADYADSYGTRITRFFRDADYADKYGTRITRILSGSPISGFFYGNA